MLFENITLLFKRKSISIAFFALLFVAAYFDSLITLVRLWAGVEFTIYRYGFLVLASSVYLLFAKKDKLNEITSQPTLWALIPTAVFSVTWLIGTVADIQTVQLALIPFIVLSVLTVLQGLGFLRLVFLPIFLIIFAIPLWWPLLVPLKLATVAVTQLVLELIGKPVFVDGYFLHLPGGSFFVDDGCAGLRFLLVTLILAFISIDMYGISLKKSLLLLSLCASLALLANWVRVIVVVLVGDYTLMEHSLVEDHNNLGWAVYGVLVLLPFFISLRYLTDPFPQDAAEPDQGSEVAVSRKQQLSVSLLLAIALVSPPLVLLFAESRTPTLIDVSIPQPAENWTRSIQTISVGSQWAPNYDTAQQKITAVYRKEGQAIQLHLFNYPEQGEGAELINVNNTLVDGESWNQSSNSIEVINLDPNLESLKSVNSAEIRNSRGLTKLVWYWYEVGSRSTTNEYVAKLYQFFEMLDGRNDANLVAISSDCSYNCEANDLLLQEFLNEYLLKIKNGMNPE